MGVIAQWVHTFRARRAKMSHHHRLYPFNEWFSTQPDQTHSAAREPNLNGGRKRSLARPFMRFRHVERRPPGYSDTLCRGWRRH